LATTALDRSGQARYAPPDGVLAAAALRCVAGQMQGRLVYESDDQIERVRAIGHPDPKRCCSVEEMTEGDVMFAATGVSHGAMLRSVRRRPDNAITHSIVLRSHSGTVRFIEAHDKLEQKTWTPT
jgi:fructose-1,6-bisphosphatase II / sedoheptulose-1,7-bisphosphatase